MKYTSVFKAIFDLKHIVYKMFKHIFKGFCDHWAQTMSDKHLYTDQAFFGPLISKLRHFISTILKEIIINIQIISKLCASHVHLLV